MKNPCFERLCGYVLLAFYGVDVGMVVTFFPRGFHAGILLILVAVNVGFLATILAFRRLTPSKTN